MDIPVRLHQSITCRKSGISPMPVLLFERTENRGKATPERLSMPVFFHLSPDFVK
jgi:hypothetical protein